MPIFEAQSRWYRHGGLLIFLLQISLFIAALPGFHHGTWFQVEPTLWLLLILAACNAAWLGIGFFTGYLLLRRPLHPLLLCMTAWVVWQWLTLGFAPSPWRSWFGHPAIGEGAAYYTALLLAYLLAATLWRERVYQKIILAVATLDAALMAWFHFDPAALCGLKAQGDVWNDLAPGNWPDYLAFIAMYLWIAFAASRVRTPSRFVWMTLIVVLIVEIVASNNTAKPLFRLAIIGGGAILWLRAAYRPRFLSPEKGWRILAMLGCVVPLAWLVMSQNPKWAALADCSIPMRAMFNQVALAAMQHEPVRWLVGGGWGRFPNDLFKYALVDGVSVFQQGARIPSWGMIDSHAFHPHNELTEALLAQGLPGLLLWLAMPVAAIWRMPRRLFWRCTPMLLAVVGLQSFWFSLPQAMGFQALALAAISSVSCGEKRYARVLAWPCALLAVVMAWSACAQWQAIAYGDALSQALNDESADHYSIDSLSDDMPRGGDRFIAAADFFQRHVGSRTVTHEADARDAAWYRLLMQTAHRASASPQSDAWLASTDMRLLNFLFMNVNASVLDTLKPEAREMLPEAAMNITVKAPLREDMVAPFLYSLAGFTGGDALHAVDILQRILTVAPDHRAALWVMGTYLVQNPDTQAEGKDMLRRAAMMGVTRVYPVTKAEVAAMVR